MNKCTRTITYVKERQDSRKAVLRVKRPNLPRAQACKHNTPSAWKKYILKWKHAFDSTYVNKRQNCLNARAGRNVDSDEHTRILRSCHPRIHGAYNRRRKRQKRGVWGRCNLSEFVRIYDIIVNIARHRVGLYDCVRARVRVRVCVLCVQRVVRLSVH